MLKNLSGTIAVIKSVLGYLTNLKVHYLPKSTFARLIFSESRRLSQLQITESLISDYKKSFNSLHSDGTSKFGEHYETYNVATGKGHFSAVTDLGWYARGTRNP